MSLPTLSEHLFQLPAIGLAELDARAALLTRRDRKYLVPIEAAADLLGSLAGQAAVLEIDGLRAFRYESVYFDTPEHRAYLTSAFRRPHRFKVRTRAYLDTGRCVLEVKTRDARGRTVKTQYLRDIALRHRLEQPDRELVASFPEIGALAKTLEPALTTSYTRASLLVGSAGARATVDTDVMGIAPDGRCARLVGMVIVESKSAGAPSSLDRVLWSMGHRPIRISKFGTSLAALYPELPSNKWHRALTFRWLLPKSDPSRVATRDGEATGGARA